MRRHVLIAAVVAFACASRVLAGVELRAYHDTAGQNACVSAPPAFQPADFHIVVTGSDALTSVSFRVDMPPALLWIEDESAFSHTNGSSPLGISITFDGCLTPPVHVLTIHAFSGVWSCYHGPQFVNVEQPSAVGCSAGPVNASGGITLISDGPCAIPVAENPSPADHAHDVPTVTTLAWTIGPAVDCGAEGPYTRVYFGTNPDPPALPYGQVYPPINPGNLSPATQYYWRVESIDYTYGTRLGPLWTFQTAGPLATQASTWGRIKSLYRH